MKRHSLFVLVCAAMLALAIVAVPQAENSGDPLLLLLQQEAAPETSLLPADATVVTDYRDGSGTPIGVVDFVENDAYILHQGEPTTAYKAKKTQSVFTNDTLVVAASSRMVVLLNDQSQFTLSQTSWLRLDKSVYDPQTGVRDTVVSLAAGKARFVVKKLVQAGGENFRVDTPVASCGVRGSDFVVALVPKAKLPTLGGWFDDLGPKAAQAAWWRHTGNATGQNGPRSWTLTDPATQHSAELQQRLPQTPTSPTPPAELVATGVQTTLEVANLTGSQLLRDNQVISIHGPNVPLPTPRATTPGAYGQAVQTFSAQPSNMSMPEVFE